MSIKLTTPEQVAKLCKNDIVIRYPKYGDAVETFAEASDKNTDTYEVRSVSATHDIIELVMTGKSLAMFASPGAVGRVFIKSADLMTEKIWWV